MASGQAEPARRRLLAFARLCPASSIRKVRERKFVIPVSIQCIPPHYGHPIQPSACASALHGILSHVPQGKRPRSRSRTRRLLTGSTLTGWLQDVVAQTNTSSDRTCLMNSLQNEIAAGLCLDGVRIAMIPLHLSSVAFVLDSPFLFTTSSVLLLFFYTHSISSTPSHPPVHSACVQRLVHHTPLRQHPRPCIPAPYSRPAFRTSAHSNNRLESPPDSFAPAASRSRSIYSLLLFTTSFNISNSLVKRTMRATKETALTRE